MTRSKLESKQLRIDSRGVWLKEGGAMDGLIARVAQAALRAMFGSDTGESTGGGVSTGMAALILAAAGRDGTVSHARRGAQGLCRSLFRGVLEHEKQGAVVQSQDHGAMGLAEDARSQAGGLVSPGSRQAHIGLGGGSFASDATQEAPILLKMRDHAPPSFWEPER